MNIPWPPYAIDRQRETTTAAVQWGRYELKAVSNSLTARATITESIPGHQIRHLDKSVATLEKAMAEVEKAWPVVLAASVKRGEEDQQILESMGVEQ